MEQRTGGAQEEQDLKFEGITRDTVYEMRRGDRLDKFTLFDGQKTTKYTLTQLPSGRLAFIELH